MRIPRQSLIAIFIPAIAVCWMWAGCKKPDESGAASPAVEGSKPEATAKTTAKTTTTEPTGGINDKAVQMKLAMADAVDGKVDHVVSKCAKCMLGMDGSAEHAAKYAGYTLHFCSADCKEGFEKDPEQSVLALKVDE